MIFYVVHYNEELFSNAGFGIHTDLLKGMDTTRDALVKDSRVQDNSRDEDIQMIKENQRKLTYKSFFEAKMLMSESSLKDCFFFLIINV